MCGCSNLWSSASSDYINSNSIWLPLSFSLLTTLIAHRILPLMWSASCTVPNEPLPRNFPHVYNSVISSTIRKFRNVEKSYCGFLLSNSLEELLDNFESLRLIDNFLWFSSFFITGVATLLDLGGKGGCCKCFYGVTKPSWFSEPWLTMLRFALLLTKLPALALENLTLFAILSSFSSSIKPSFIYFTVIGVLCGLSFPKSLFSSGIPDMFPSSDSSSLSSSSSGFGAFVRFLVVCKSC